MIHNNILWPDDYGIKCQQCASKLRHMCTVQYIQRNIHTVFALLCFVVVIHWLVFPYPSGLLHWHCGNLTIATVPAKQPWWIWINTSCEFIMNDCITTTKQSTTKPCAYFLGYTVGTSRSVWKLCCYVLADIRQITQSNAVIDSFFHHTMNNSSYICDQIFVTSTSI